MLSNYPQPPILKINLRPPSCHVGQRRIHHAWPGLALTLAGIALIAHDWHDRHHWIPDLRAL